MQDGLFSLGEVSIPLPKDPDPCRLTLTLTLMDAPEISNHYTLWMYPKEQENDLAANLLISHSLTDTLSALSEGKKVLFLPRIPAPANPPEKEAPEKFIAGTYCTDFWNYPMFRSISESVGRAIPVGTLGILADPEHPALAEFPTLPYSTPQWYDIVTDAPVPVLDGSGITPILRTIDNCERNHNLGILWEAKCANGQLLVCTSPLDDRLISLPCRQLLKSLLHYMDSASFAPKQTVSCEYLETLFA